MTELFNWSGEPRLNENASKPTEQKVCNAPKIRVDHTFPLKTIQHRKDWYTWEIFLNFDLADR